MRWRRALCTQAVGRQEAQDAALIRRRSAGQGAKKLPGRPGPRGAKDAELLRERLDGVSRRHALPNLYCCNEASARILAGGGASWSAGVLPLPVQDRPRGSYECLL